MKQVSGFVSKEDYEQLKQLAKDADKPLSRYVTRLLEAHVRATGTAPTTDSNTDSKEQT